MNSVQEIAAASAKDWYSISQKYRTKERLMLHISQAIGEALVAALKDQGIPQEVTKESVDAMAENC